MTLLLLILLPIIAALLCFLMKPAARYIALGISAGMVGLGVGAAAASHGQPLTFSLPWMPQMGASFTLFADGMSAMLCLLSGIVLLAVMIMQLNKEVENPGAFYALMLLSVAGINGVFLAGDGLLFYFFWELALIPVYFLSSRWGGERRIPVTFKFFVYTFAGSLFMLAALIYLYLRTPGTHSYAMKDIVAAGQSLDGSTQVWLFPMLFAAFAVKMPIFPFHTWQPDTYETSPTPVTIILSALMVKMGIYAVVRWTLPVLPQGVDYWSNTIIVLSVIGIVYASCIAMVQTDLKRLVAYSSIAHMGLMAAAAFSRTEPAMNGLLVQMFNHGINITGMWLMVQMVEQRYGTRDMTKLGGMANGAPWMTIALVVISFANIALPLTNGFVGEFMLFHGIFQGASQYHMLFMVIAGLGVILGAVYTLTMVQRVAYGNAVEGTQPRDLTTNEWWALSVIISLIIFLGVYPKPLLDLVGI